MAQPLAHPAPYTVHDLPAMPDDGNRYEVLDGQLIVSPSPTAPHQRIAYRLTSILDGAAPNGIDIIQGITVRCGDDNQGLIPDIVITKIDAMELDHTVDAADVLAVVEVVSPGSRTIDRNSKPVIYAAAGIPVYWRVETAPFFGQEASDKFPLVLVYESVKGSPYQLQGRYSAGTEILATLPFEVEFDPQELIKPRRRMP